ncbi:MAG TPA: cation transporter [Bacillota bacterium]|nr:cation transporter [Bacillota bacterium]HQC36017.1 cation transporter [Bacillota bacterium]
MKKSFKVNGLDCASCASKLERSISKIEGIDNAKVTFMTQKLTLEAADEKFDAVLEEAIAIAKKLEPDWEIVVK